MGHVDRATGKWVGAAEFQVECDEAALKGSLYEAAKEEAYRLNMANSPEQAEWAGVEYVPTLDHCIDCHIAAVDGPAHCAGHEACPGCEPEDEF